MMGRLLVFCLDGADLGHHSLHRRSLGLASLSKFMRLSSELPSTVIAQTPVAWASFVCGAPPSETGIWGWQQIGPANMVKAARLDPLDQSWQDWGGRSVLLAGMPLIGAAKWAGSESLAGVPGPTKSRGGSRPACERGAGLVDAERVWAHHHALWSECVSESGAQREFVLVHCDSVDWFSHRFGPASPAGGAGWRLADELLDDLVDRLQPESVVIVSDHGVTEVTAFVLIHDAVRQAGLAARGSAELVTLEDLVEQRVFCLSSSGALWCRSQVDADRATDLLLELGALYVERLPLHPGAPALVPRFPNGWVALVAPEDYPAGASELVLRSGPDFDALRMEHNWMGDHAQKGLLATDDERLWLALQGARLHEIKQRLIVAA